MGMCMRTYSGYERKVTMKNIRIAIALMVVVSMCSGCALLLGAAVGGGAGAAVKKKRKAEANQ